MKIGGELKLCLFVLVRECDSGSQVNASHKSALVKGVTRSMRHDDLAPQGLYWFPIALYMGMCYK